MGNIEEKTPESGALRGFRLSYCMDYLFPFAYWHYSICASAIQYAMFMNLFSYSLFSGTSHSG